MTDLNENCRNNCSFKFNKLQKTPCTCKKSEFSGWAPAAQDASLRYNKFTIFYNKNII